MLVLSIDLNFVLTLGSIGTREETGCRADMMTELMVVSPDSDSESISSTTSLVPELRRGREGGGGRERGYDGKKEKHG